MRVSSILLLRASVYPCLNLSKFHQEVLERDQKAEANVETNIFIFPFNLRVILTDSTRRRQKGLGWAGAL